jgi:hypothetical protein
MLLLCPCAGSAASSSLRATPQPMRCFKAVSCRSAVDGVLAAVSPQAPASPRMVTLDGYIKLQTPYTGWRAACDRLGRQHTLQLFVALSGSRAYFTILTCLPKKRGRARLSHCLCYTKTGAQNPSHLSHTDECTLIKLITLLSSVLVLLVLNALRSSFPVMQ